MVDLAYAMAPGPAGGANGGGGIMSVLPLMIGMFAIMYFLIIRPQQKQRKEREALLSAVKKGDRVVTSSGLFGTVVGLSEQTVTLKVADQVKLEFERSAVARIVPAQGDKESAA
ncbi:MAG TPA: preprotein translocase subunit YajC [Candidatus Nitrosotalea sp.]|jgi:preprotein translocase subunit YajC|nr:preprotein translocase subunit YajC [Candidatus Nitrosotalea sp.]